MSRWMSLAIALAALLLALTVPEAAIGAQTCTASSPGACSANTSASMIIPAVVQVTVSGAPAPQPVTVAHYLTGYGEFAGPAVTVSANTPWALSISAASPLWSATSTVPGVAARLDKPAADLLWSANAAGYSPLSIAGEQIASGLRTNAAVTALTFRVVYSLTVDTPGDYSMTVLFTVTAP